jgi:hypothetical protein
LFWAVKLEFCRSELRLSSAIKKHLSFPSATRRCYSAVEMHNSLCEETAFVEKIFANDMPSAKLPWACSENMFTVNIHVFSNHTLNFSRSVFISYQPKTKDNTFEHLREALPKLQAQLCRLPPITTHPANHQFLPQISSISLPESEIMWKPHRVSNQPEKQLIYLALLAFISSRAASGSLPELHDQLKTLFWKML